MEETKLSQPVRVTGQSVADCYSTKRSSALNALVQMYDNCVILCSGAKKNRANKMLFFTCFVNNKWTQTVKCLLTGPSQQCRYKIKYKIEN
jgi:hypothetical protein